MPLSSSARRLATAAFAVIAFVPSLHAQATAAADTNAAKAGLPLKAERIGLALARLTLTMRRIAPWRCRAH